MRSVLLAVVVSIAACKRSEPIREPVLLFAGTGTSPNDVEAIAAILDAQRIAYARIDSARLDAMSEAELSSHALLIVAGGNFEVLGNSLARETKAHVRGAVARGLSYLGICAGAFFAGDSPYNGLNLTAGVRFPFYSAEARGIRKAALTVERKDAPSLELY
jgi:glutamine amidotransferase-like uncharacterized protein